MDRIICFSTFKYADILFLPPVISAVIYLSNSIKRKTQKVGKSFETDRPITRSDDDRLNMSIYALELSNRIIGLHTEKSFAIGITGPYGSGKTSFMELVKQNLNKQREIHYN
ncbi:MAG: hypothetical protein IPL12_15825 [Bacteroidetes bacterium]|nr:hypothetical protein [Bacteroidota bacterium]